MNLLQVTLLFMAVVLINSLAVYAQHRYKLYTRLFGHHDLTAHAIVLAVIWGTLLVAVIYLKPPAWKPPSILRPLGILVASAGLWMVTVAWKRLGTAGTLNGWFFGRGQKKQLEGGVFRLRNPMYTGFALLFVGAALWLENASYLWLAAISFVLLNLIQARIESPKKSL